MIEDPLESHSHGHGGAMDRVREDLGDQHQRIGPQLNMNEAL